MDILPTSLVEGLIISCKACFMLIGLIIVVASFFQSKEASRMEEKLQLDLPVGVKVGMSMHLWFAVVFLLGAAVLWFLL